MKLDHLKNRHSNVSTANRRSEMRMQASTMNSTINCDDDNDMPFAVASTVKHIPKKSLLIAANNMMSPKSNDKMRLSFRKGSVTFDKPAE